MSFNLEPFVIIIYDIDIFKCSGQLFGRKCLIQKCILKTYHILSPCQLLHLAELFEGFRNGSPDMIFDIFPGYLGNIF